MNRVTMSTEFEFQQSTHAVAKDKMSAEELAGLEATKAVNANKSFFGL